MDMRSLIPLGDGAYPSGSRRASRLANFDAQIQDIEERRTKTALKIGGLSVREAIEMRWKR